MPGVPQTLVPRAWGTPGPLRSVRARLTRGASGWSGRDGYCVLPSHAHTNLLDGPRLVLQRSSRFFPFCLLLWRSRLICSPSIFSVRAFAAYRHNHAVLRLYPDNPGQAGIPEYARPFPLAHPGPLPDKSIHATRNLSGTCLAAA